MTPPFPSGPRDLATAHDLAGADVRDQMVDHLIRHGYIDVAVPQERHLPFWTLFRALLAPLVHRGLVVETAYEVRLTPAGKAATGEVRAAFGPSEEVAR